MSGNYLLFHWQFKKFEWLSLTSERNETAIYEFTQTHAVKHSNPGSNYHKTDILVRTKLRTDKQTNVTKGSFQCGKNYITCRYITDGRTNYTFSATGEMRTIHDRIECNSKNRIYMIHCPRGNKQYKGGTRRRLNDSFLKCRDTNDQ